MPAIDRAHNAVSDVPWSNPTAPGRAERNNVRVLRQRSILIKSIAFADCPGRRTDARQEPSGSHSWSHAFTEPGLAIATPAFCPAGSSRSFGSDRSFKIRDSPMHGPREPRRDLFFHQIPKLSSYFVFSHLPGSD